ncbi:MAG: hypothetical protein ACRDKG_10105 [Actinomycetota bacterium]
MEVTAQVDGSERRVRVAELGSAWIGILAGMALTILRSTNGDAHDRAILPTLVFGLVVAVPGLLALTAMRRRPALYLASGLAYLPMSFLSVVTFPLILVAAMAFVAYGRHADEETPLVWPPLTAVTLFILTIATFVALLFNGGDDPSCSSTASSTSCTSDIITNGEALVGLAGVALTLSAGWVLSLPRERGTAT